MAEGLKNKEPIRVGGRKVSPDDKEESAKMVGKLINDKLLKIITSKYDRAKCQ